MQWARATAAVFALFLAVGCNSDPASQKFQTYNQLLTQEGGDDPSSATPPASGDSLNPAASADRDPTDGPSGTQSGKTPATAATEDTNNRPPPAVTFEEEAEIPASALAPLNIVDGSSTSDILKVTERSTTAGGTTTEGAVSAAGTTMATAAPGGIQLLVAEKAFKSEGPRDSWRVSYDDLDLLKILNMEPVPADATRYFPEWLAGLNGRQVRIRGFMYPTFESSGIEQFVLARDNQICCFGRDPKVYDLIAVTMAAGKTTDYIPNRPFDVVGTFRIDLLTEGGKPLGLYWLEDARVMDR